ncbi:hypothetical protein AWB67_00833 [Caballeronia terrestris]|jgi:hypothetical protein|uniref:DUF3303 domain-containing protein n=2 Tax=Caballeronia TaxID=1827195 RepID=A0A158FSG0_9BURK|nr:MULTISPECIES: DUF3303 family protein [Caballeronia]SAL22776.1 hypothetical protein AWB67_00833 [Caballeronia terrestris]SAL45295.1 hypothetical protein AWB65_03530 [Caballeronia humi]
MLFIAKWTALPTAEQAASERFRRTGGAPPDGIKVIGRWHAVGGVEGLAICECATIEPLAAWVLEWADLMSFDVKPGLTDEQLGVLLTAAAEKK